MAAHETSAHAGQTGSGKTYTMGSAFGAGAANHGVIPNVMATLFELVHQVGSSCCGLVDAVGSYRKPRVCRTSAETPVKAAGLDPPDAANRHQIHPAKRRAQC